MPKVESITLVKAWEWECWHGNQNVEVGDRCKLGWKVTEEAMAESLLDDQEGNGGVERYVDKVKSGGWRLYGPGSVRILLGRNHGDGSEVLLG